MAARARGDGTPGPCQYFHWPLANAHTVAMLAAPVYAVVACSSCRAPWLVELRHATASCPGCGKKAELARRRRLWQGGSMAQAKAAVAAHRAALAQGADIATATAAIRPQESMARHDDPIDAAAAQTRHVRNISERADLVALWITRLLGDADHDTYIAALGRAGVPPGRREKEVVRMLATDVIYEPRAGHYRSLEA